uniref:Uncharacterized protein n=1 Tax=Solanum tuberosum TaxID=4113 RepID=M1DVV0_SOLTU
MDAHKMFDEKLSTYFPTLFPETQSDTPIEMGYVNAIDLDRGSNEQHTHEIDTLEGVIFADEIIPYVECGKSYRGEEHDKGNLLLNIGATTFVVQVQGIASNLTYGGEEHDEGSVRVIVTIRAYTLDVAGTRRPLLVPKRTLVLADYKWKTNLIMQKLKTE